MNGRRRRWPAAVAAAVVLVMAMGVAKYQRMPSVGNVLDVAGVGPSTISRHVASPDVAWILHRGWQVVTVLGIVAAAVLLRTSAGVARHAFTRRSGRDRIAMGVFTLTAIALYLVPVAAMQQGSWFDRYLLPVVPLAMVLVAMSPPVVATPGAARWRASLAAMLLVAYGLCTVIATHDYLSWSRERWAAVQALLAQPGVSVRDVDPGGGREVRGWYLGHRVAQCGVDQRGGPDAERSWQDFSCLRSAGDEAYVVSLHTRDGYRVAAEYGFRRWLPFRAQRFYVLQRDAAAEPEMPATDGRRLTSQNER